MNERSSKLFETPRLRLSRLSRTEPTPFRILPDAGTISELASGLSLLALVKAGHRKVWSILGVNADANVRLTRIEVTPARLELGESLHIRLRISWHCNATSGFVLMVPATPSRIQFQAQKTRTGVLK